MAGVYKLGGLFAVGFLLVVVFWAPTGFRKPMVFWTPTETTKGEITELKRVLLGKGSYLQIFYYTYTVEGESFEGRYKAGAGWSRALEGDAPRIKDSIRNPEKSKPIALIHRRK